MKTIDKVILCLMFLAGIACLVVAEHMMNINITSVLLAIIMSPQFFLMIGLALVFWSSVVILNYIFR